jgi:PAS domain S-box-containing protein
LRAGGGVGTLAHVGDGDQVASGTLDVGAAVPRPKAGDAEPGRATRLRDIEGAILDRLTAAVVATDLAGRLLYANPYALRLYGWEGLDVVGRQTAALAGVALSVGVMAEIAAAVNNGGTWEGDFTVARGDGTSITVHACDSGLYDAHDRLVGIVSLVVDVTDDRHSAEHLASEARAHAFLLRVSEVLWSSRDYGECLRQLTALTVPELADICLIDVLVDGDIVRMATAHSWPEAGPVLAEFEAEYPPDPSGAHPAAVAIRSGTSTHAEEMPDDFLRRTCRDERHFQLVKQLGFQSYMCAPLTARGRALGAITLVSTDPARRYGARDLALVEELARRAGLVIDNVRLLEERTRIAQALQSALLPPTLPAVPGLELAAAYRAAGEGNTVGGDFYDVFDLGADAWAAVIGDVAGTGAAAAAATGIVRHALRASGLRDRDPAVMLQTANTMLTERRNPDDEQFCSACCLIIKPGVVTRLDIASAGHCPPVLIRADGEIAELDTPGGLLGIQPQFRAAIRQEALEPGDRLVLFTDGLTEARDAAGRFYGDERLHTALRAAAGLSAQAMVDSLLSDVTAFSNGKHRDDLALLVVAVPPLTGHRKP